jgi:translation elongation factor EF-4
MVPAVHYKDRTVTVSNPTEFPDVTDVASHVKEVQEPIVKATIIVPERERAVHTRARAC